MPSRNPGALGQSSSSPASDDQDRADMKRLAEDHDAALTDIMNRHGERLFHFLLRALQNESEAADLAQETFVRVYQNRARFDPARKFTTWLYAIAANLVRDRFRWRSRHPEAALQASEAEDEADWLAEMPDPGATPGESLERAERGEAVRRAIGKLPEDLKTPLILAEYEGLPHAEIAEITGTTAKAVEMRIYRARQQLRQTLAGLLKG